MGCSWCKEKDDTSNNNGDHHGETERLLENCLNYDNDEHPDLHQDASDSAPARPLTTQELMVSIIQQAAVAVVDVYNVESAVDGADYSDRAELYSQRLLERFGHLPLKSHSWASPGVADPVAVLSLPRVSQMDLQLISNVADKIPVLVGLVRVKPISDPVLVKMPRIA